MLRGTPGRDTICAFGGNDVLIGLGGRDVIRGGPGTGTVSYAEMSFSVTVQLAVRRARTFRGTDLLFDVENVRGTRERDELTGDVGPNVLIGGYGNDVLRGAGGDDRLVSGLGDNDLYGGKGDDVLVGRDGDDYFFTSPGCDRYIGGRPRPRGFHGAHDAGQGHARRRHRGVRRWAATSSSNPRKSWAVAAMTGSSARPRESS